MKFTNHCYYIILLSRGSILATSTTQNNRRTLGQILRGCVFTRTEMASIEITELKTLMEKVFQKISFYTGKETTINLPGLDNYWAVTAPESYKMECDPKPEVGNFRVKKVGRIQIKLTLNKRPLLAW